MKKRKLMYLIMLIIGIAGILDTIFVLTIVPGINLGVILPSIIGTFLFIYSVVKLINKNYIFIKNKKLSTFIRVIFALGLSVFIIIEAMIISSGYSEIIKRDIDYVMVLGAGIDNRGEPSPLLKNRLDICVEYIVNNPDAKIIVSGGKGYGRPISEAESMKNYLIKHGIESKRILKEEKSTSTYENFLYTKQKLKNNNFSNSNFIVITNDFHLMRAKTIGKKLGFTVYGLAAKTPKSTIINSYLREFFAVVKTWIVDL